MVRVRRASAFDFLRSVDPVGRFWVRNRLTFGQQARVLAESAAMALETEAGELVAVAGLYSGALSEGTEAWFAAGPALKANLLAALGRLAQSLEIVAQEAPGLAVTAYIDPRSVAGPRLAFMFGFDEVGVDPGTGLVAWRRVL